MFLDDHSRRKVSCADLDHRRDGLHLMRRQQRRTRAVFEGLRASEESKAHMAPAGAAPEDGAFESIVARVRRCRLAVSVRIDALAGLSDEMRRELRARFDAIDPWRPAADAALMRFENDVATHTAALRADDDAGSAPCCQRLLTALALLRAACRRYPAVL